MKNKKLELLISFFLFLGLFFLFFLSPTDPDLGWQIRCGQELWTQGKTCSPNQYSVLLENFPFVNHSTGYQFLIFPFYKTLGFWGLSLLNSLILVISIFFLLKLPGNKNIRLLLLPFALFFSWSVFAFGIRGQILGFLFFVLILCLIETKKEDLKNLWFIPLIILFWANSHGSFILGIILVCALLFEKTIFFLKKQILLKEYRSYWLIFIASLLGSLINPFTYKIYLEAWRHFQVVKLENLIAEWVPPNFYIQTAIIFLVLINISFFFFKKKFSFFQIVILIFLAILTLKARRNLSFFFVFVAYSLTSIDWKIKNLEPFSLLVGISLFVWGGLIQLPTNIGMNKDFQKYCRNSSPQYSLEAVNFLKSQTEKGNIFNTYEQGGFLIWQLPEYKIFVDGRMPAWETPSGKSPYTIYLETLQTQPGWEKTLEEYKINWLFIGSGTFMDLKIKDNPKAFDWKEVYRDKITVIYKKLI